MTNYYLSSSYGNKPNAGSKARNDVDEILKNKGFQEIKINSNLGFNKNKLKKFLFHKEYVKNCIKINRELKTGDVLFFQHPIQGALEFSFLLSILNKKKVQVVAIVHDLEIFRKWDVNFDSKRANLNDVTILSKCSSVILHNESMIEKYIEETQINPEKLVDLEIFDYLSKYNVESKKTSQDITVAGNLRKDKSGYVYNLDSVDYNFTLFGIGFEVEKKMSNIDYRGSVDPDKLVDTLTGKFGLVWDGESIETCTGSTGEYLKVNNPHKTSLYLVSGLPVIIWDKAALASFITKNKLGITVSSLNDIPEAIASISDDAYEVMKENCLNVSKKIANGFYMNEAIEKSLKIIKRGDI